MSEPIPENTGYEPVTEKVVEVRTPNSSTRAFTLPTKKSNSKENYSKSQGTNAKCKE